MIRSIRVKTIADALDYLKQYVRNKEEAGESTLVFAEDRLTLLCEQAICQEMGGSFLTDVVTFARYLNKRSDRVLTKQGSVMKIGELMQKNREALACFNKDYSARTSAKMVYETIAQFAACRIAPSDLDALSLDDPALMRKIKDVSLLYREYLAFLQREGFADENTLLSLLPSALYEDASLSHKNVLFFAFGSFTGQAAEGVRCCMERAKSVVGVFLNGAEEYYTGEGENRFLAIASDFGGAKGYERPSSFDEVRKRLSSALYSAEVFRTDYIPCQTNRVRILECENKSREAETAVALVRKAVAEGARYRDISIFVPDVNAYYGELKKNFDSYRIPCFADVKKPLSAHPVSSFLLSLLQAVEERCLPASVSDVLSSVFFGDKGVLLNYLDKFVPFRGGVLRPIKNREVLEQFGFDYDEVSAARERFLSLYNLFRPKDTGEGYAQALYQALYQVGANEVLSALSDEEEDVAMKSFLSQIDPTLDKLLSEITSIAGKNIFTAGEFYDILSDGFSSAEISLIPIKPDAVFIGDISSSKTNSGKVAVCLGLTQKVPCYSSDVALISDRDIHRLKQGNIDVEPLIAEVNLRARESVCLNLLSFTERLYLTYPVSDGGAENGKSEILSYVGRALACRAEREADLFPYDCAQRIPAEKRMFYEEDALRTDEKRPPQIYSALCSLLDGNAVRERYAQNKKESISLGKSLFLEGREFLSPTLLENFNTCPYRNFVERGLRLEEREEGLIAFSSSGTFLHEVLRRVGEGIRSGEIQDIETCSRVAEEAGEEVLSRPEYVSLRDSASDRYFAERMIADGKSIAKEAFRQLENSAFTVESTEKSCFDRSLNLRGFIDRIDVSEDFFRIVDYKTGTIKTDLKYYYVGTKLQLELYASNAIGSYPDKNPAGVFYFPARVDFSAVDDDESAYALKGYFLNDSDAIERLGVLSSKSRKIPAGGFPLFLRYAEEMARHTRSLVERGYIKPSPCDNACGYCKYKGMCGFDGEQRPFDFSKLSVEKIIEIVLNKEEKDG